MSSYQRVTKSSSRFQLLHLQQLIKRCIMLHAPTHSILMMYCYPCCLACVCGCVSDRYERLEDQLNDLTELHQHETSNLKQELASIEEKVAYQAYERARDIQVITAAG